MITLRLVMHHVHGGQAVEVLKGGKVCAVIYPGSQGEDLKIVSAHFAGELETGEKFPAGVKMDNGEDITSPVPAVNITFDPRPFVMEHGKVVRLKQGKEG